MDTRNVLYLCSQKEGGVVAKKLGRPTDNPAKNQLRIRLTDEELAKLEESSEILGINKSDVVRLGIDKVFVECKKN